MSKTVVCIVEGFGEVQAVPVLLRRLAEAKGVYDLNIPPPIRVPKDKFLQREEEFERQLLLAAAKAQGGAVLVLLDADDDCPTSLAQDVLTRGQRFVSGACLHVVIANREYEAWLVAAADSLAGRRGLSDALEVPLQPDDIRDAKGWLSERMPNQRYHEVSDQPAFSAVFDLGKARERSRSFRKLALTIEDVISGER